MRGLILIITAILLSANGLPKTYTNKKALLEDQRLHCDSLCTTFDGAFEFDDKLKTCICHVGKYFDDTEITLMRKNAKAMGMNLKTIKATPKILSKRDTVDQEPSGSEPTPEETKKNRFSRPFIKGPLFSDPKDKEPLAGGNTFQLPQGKFSRRRVDGAVLGQNNGEDDAIVGGAKANPNGGIKLNTRASSRPTPPQSSPLQPGAMKDVWMKARQRLDHLIKHSEGNRFNSRFAQSETQAIRNTLKPLTLKNKPKTSPKSAATKPSMGMGKIGGGAKPGAAFSKQPQGPKAAGSPVKPFTAHLGPAQQRNSKPQLNLLSKNSKGGNPLKPGGVVRPRMNGGHSLVGAAGPASETGDVVPAGTAKPPTSTETKSVDIGKKNSMDGTEKKIPKKKGKDKEVGTRKEHVDDVEAEQIKIAVQPENTISGENSPEEE